MKRNEWRRKADVYSQSAVSLLATNHHDVAYHLAGVAVECALKAKIAGRFGPNEIPERRLVESIYKNGHNLIELMKLAQLDGQLTKDEGINATLSAYWNTVKVWNIDSRYQNWSQVEAEDMVEAVVKRGAGLLAWIRRNS